MLELALGVGRRDPEGLREVLLVDAAHRGGPTAVGREHPVEPRDDERALVLERGHVRLHGREPDAPRQVERGRLGVHEVRRRRPGRARELEDVRGRRAVAHANPPLAVARESDLRLHAGQGGQGVEAVPRAAVRRGLAQHRRDSRVVEGLGAGRRRGVRLPGGHQHDGARRVAPVHGQERERVVGVDAVLARHGVPGAPLGQQALEPDPHARGVRARRGAERKEL
ncbi:hypothetical protein GCM10025864_35460 [Luteimicrobium album]|uniref:Uncharacterized protein n=1 Tax=Luteimicrobium album TaxID=1054550 RepID=A0ABQ6I6F1_9MICO|nr:hypothetical protein GCM10025864_35460 [Luteimicrobium album]